LSSLEDISSRWKIVEQEQILTIASHQFGANHQKDIMRNRVIAVISLNTNISMTLLAVSEINVGRLIIHSSPELSWREAMA
jgi:hypothetical protein